MSDDLLAVVGAEWNDDMRKTADLNKELLALESEVASDDEKADDIMDDIEKRAVGRGRSIDTSATAGVTWSDLLNGYVVDDDTLSAIDQCVLKMTSEWDSSELVNKTVADCARLLTKQCAQAHDQLISRLLCPTNEVYTSLLRLARKIMATSLVIHKEKMIYIPNDMEALEEIGNSLRTMDNVVVVDRNHKKLVVGASPELERLVFSQRTLYRDTAVCRQREQQYMTKKSKGGMLRRSQSTRGASSMTLTQSDDDDDEKAKSDDDEKAMSDDDDEKAKSDDDDDDKANTKPGAPSTDNGVNGASGAVSAKQLEDQIMNHAPQVGKVRSMSHADSVTFAANRSRAQSVPRPHPARDGTMREMAPLGASAGDANLKEPTRERAQTAAQLSAGDGKLKELKKAHPTDIRCEGCGNLIDFVQDYEHVTCYYVPIKDEEEQLFYFHDSYCVTLRRLKESIRRYVMDQSLPKSRRSTSTVGYVRNLLANFNTLITTRGVLPRPNPDIGQKKQENRMQLNRMQFIRSNAHRLILRQQALEKAQDQNLDDEDSNKFKDIPQIVQCANMTIYGSCLAKFLIQQLLSKQLVPLWQTLGFVTANVTATVSLQIVEEHRTDLAKVKEMEHLDLVLSSMIEAADYTVAMALYLSAYMQVNAANDLSRSADFQEVAQKYIRIASQLIASVESDHLLSLLLEVPTDIAHMSVFELAIKYEICDFMDDSRIQMLMAHMWSEFDFLDPAVNFRMKDITLFELLGRLVKSPAPFYYCPVGRYWTESVMYMVYVLLVTSVVYGDDGTATYTMSSSLSATEFMMWTFNVGFVTGELTQMMLQGVSYMADPANSFDVLIMCNWAVLAALRFCCSSIFSDGCDAYTGAVTSEDDVDLGNTRNEVPVLIYMGVFCMQIIILWSRIQLIFATNRGVGPFISMVPNMIKDILKWTFVLSIFYFGFCFGTYFIIAGDLSEYCAGDSNDAEYDSFSLLAEYNFILLMGQSDWAVLEENACMNTSRSLILKLYMYFFSVLGTVLLLNLLIAMMASTYETIQEGTTKQVNFGRAEETFHLSHSNAIIPPPLNVVVYGLAVFWFTFEFLLWVVSCGTLMINIEALVPVFVNYASQNVKENRNYRDKEKTKLYCCGAFQKVKNPKQLVQQKLLKNYGETARYCQFCRCYMRQNGDISRYFKLFVNYRLDEHDVKFMESLMQSSGICPQCYRPYRIYETTSTGMITNRLYRWQVVLELLSFYVFMLVIWAPLIFLIALPGIFDALFNALDDVTSATKIISAKRASIIKDDKYVQLVKSIIEKEGTNDTEMLSAQMSKLYQKLMSMKRNQQKSANVLSEQSLALEDQSRVLTGLVPYIKQIDTKMDTSATAAREQHDDQVSAIHARARSIQQGLKKQSIANALSRALTESLNTESLNSKAAE